MLVAFGVFTGLMLVLPRLASEREDLERQVSGQENAEEALFRLIEETRGKSRAFFNLSEKVENPILAGELRRIADAVSQMMDVLKNDLALMPRARSLMSYHLDKGLEVANAYIRLSADGAHGEAAQARLAAGEAVLVQMRESVEAQLHAMRDKDFRELEISAESLARILRQDSSPPYRKGKIDE